MLQRPAPGRGGHRRGACRACPTRCRDQRNPRTSGAAFRRSSFSASGRRHIRTAGRWRRGRGRAKMTRACSLRASRQDSAQAPDLLDVKQALVDGIRRCRGPRCAAKRKRFGAAERRIRTRPAGCSTAGPRRPPTASATFDCARRRSNETAPPRPKSDDVGRSGDRLDRRCCSRRRRRRPGSPTAPRGRPAFPGRAGERGRRRAQHPTVVERGADVQRAPRHWRPGPGLRAGSSPPAAETNSAAKRAASRSGRRGDIAAGALDQGGDEVAGGCRR